MKTFVTVSAFWLAVSVSASAQTLLITTVAGYPGKGSNDGVGASALFTNPQGVATDASGNIYVADTGNNVVRMVTSNGVSSTLAGLAGVSGSTDGTGTNALFNQPCGIAVDASNNVYVSDYGSSTIRKIVGGVVTTWAGAANVNGAANNTGTNATFFHPMGLAIDGSNNLYVADYGNHLIRKINSSRLVTTFAGLANTPGSANGTPGSFNEPEAITVDGSGTLYVADTGNAAVRMITSAGAVSTLAGSPGSVGSTDGTGTNAYFYQPDGIAISGSTLYVSDAFNNTIRQVSTGGAVITFAGLAGTTGSADGATSSARFWAPQGLAVNASGTVYIADTANSTIRQMTTNGVVTTLAGSPSVGSTDGAASSARFFAPQNVAVDAQTNVYIADTLNSVIRKISPAGVVSTLAGLAGVTGTADGFGSTARFLAPEGIAVDASGTVYVSDTGNNTIRKISGGSVVTLAGLAGFAGNADGSGTNAHFTQPLGLAVDGSGNIFVADSWNHTVREITSGGTVTTLAGLAGTPGTFDGANSAARFNLPAGVAVDGSDNVYVTDYNNDTIRMITSSGVVSTIAGLPGTWGSADGASNTARFFQPTGISLDASGNLYVADMGNATIRRLVNSSGTWITSTVAGSVGTNGSADGLGSSAQFYYPAGVTVSPLGYVYIADGGNNSIRSQGIAPMLLSQPLSQSILTNTTATFSVSTYGSSPFTYVWKLNGSNYPASSSPTFVASNAGTYTVLISNLAGSTISQPAVLTVTNSSVGIAGVFQSITRLTNGNVQFSLSGTAGASYTLDYSTNLPTWIPLISFTMSSGGVQITDTNATNAAEFYRISSP